MEVNCQFDKPCLRCNPDCELYLPHNKRLVEVRKQIATVLFDIANVSELMTSSRANVSLNYPVYIGFDSYVLECRFNELKVELMKLRVEEENIVKTLRRITN